MTMNALFGDVRVSLRLKEGQWRGESKHVA